MSHCQEYDPRLLQELQDVANKLRIHTIRACKSAGSGHLTTCCSAAEIISVLFMHTMRYTVKEPRNPASDRFVLSKGHAAPILYAAWVEAGLLTPEDILALRSVNSNLEGHPTPRLDFVDVATGSLGQGLSCAAGMAYTGKYFDKAGYRVYCLIGDGEAAEGSIWEAMSFSSAYQLDNLVAIFDINRLGQSEPTCLGHDMEAFKRRVEGFGWKAYVVDGHKVEEVCRALDAAATVKGRPTCILAKTFKGAGLPIDAVDNPDWHGRVLVDQADEVIQTIFGRIKNKGAHGISIKAPDILVPDVNIRNIKLSHNPNYSLGHLESTREAYGTAMRKIAETNDRVVVFDADTKISTRVHNFPIAFPDRFVECYIAEQNLVSVATGCATRDRVVAFASTFSAFMTRAHDQIRMGAISQTNVNLCGSHCGVSIGQDGPSQMGLEDLALFRSVPGCTVFYPSDAVSCERAVEIAANTPGMCYIRTSRPDTPVIYENAEVFSIGKAKVVRQNESDVVTVVGAGVTLIEAIKAADELVKSNIHIRIIDPFTIKPLDAITIMNNARLTGGRVITVEDHYAEGGLGEAVCGGLADFSDVKITQLCVKEVPRSGQCDELLDKYGISAKYIIKAVKAVCSLYDHFN